MSNQYFAYVFQKEDTTYYVSYNGATSDAEGNAVTPHYELTEITTDFTVEAELDAALLVVVDNGDSVNLRPANSDRTNFGYNGSQFVKVSRANTEDTSTTDFVLETVDDTSVRIKFADSDTWLAEGDSNALTTTDSQDGALVLKMTQKYYCPLPFVGLYHTYTGLHNGEDTVGNTLLKAAQGGVGITGPLVIINNTHVMAYEYSDPTKTEAKLLYSADFRSSWLSGFYEMTAVSHVGPAIMSLNYLLLNDYDTTVLQNLVDQLKDYVAEVSELNAVPLDGSGTHWLERLKASGVTTYESWEAQIQKMVNHACNVATDFINEIDLSDKNSIDSKMQSDFLQRDVDGGGYENIMVSTFMLAALGSAVKVYEEVFSNFTKEDWQGARVVIQSFPGEIYYFSKYGQPKSQDEAGARRFNMGNLTAGLMQDTNWFVAMLNTLSGGDLPNEQIVIPGYAPILDLEGEPRDLTAFEHGYYASVVWSGLYYRSKTASAAMSGLYDFPENYGIKKVGLGVAGKSTVSWPGDYDYPTDLSNPSDLIYQIMQRCQYSFENISELLSNTVGFWLVPEFADKNKVVADMHIPGLTDVEYPDMNSTSTI